MPSLHSPFVSIGLSRLRRGVSACCCVIAAALLVQALVWCFATFTDVRFETVQAKPQPATIVSASEVRPVTTRNGTEVTTTLQTASTVADPNRVLSRHDPILDRVSSLARAAGTLATFMLIPLIALGVLLGVGSATQGVEQTVSAFMWSIAIALLVLPTGEFIGLPWTEGALTTYTMMTSQVSAQVTGTAEAMGNATFYARFALLPLACVAGIAMVGVRFSAGVGGGIIPKENLRLDPILEKEAANIKASSLHGGRAVGALRAAGVASHANGNGNAANAASAASERKPAMAGAGVPTSAGEAPRRLI